MKKMPLTVLASTSHGSFLYFGGFNRSRQSRRDIAFLGIPYGSAFTPDALSNYQIFAPDTIRRMTDRISRGLKRFDFVVGGPIYGDRSVRAIDVGNVPYDLEVSGGGHFARAEEAIRKILRAGAVPITFGGDYGIPIPIFRALSERGGDPITLVQIDVHIGWRDHVNDVHDGLSSPIRRASEMPSQLELRHVRQHATAILKCFQGRPSCRET